MLTRKPCKWCGSFWHSKAKCDKRENKPLKAVYKQKGTNSRLSPENPSERLRIAYKGKGERSQLVGEADKLFSIHIRQRGMDWAGDNTCYTCDVRLPWGQLQCGHFISRRYTNTRWNALNCWPQCNECNVEKQGNLIVYEARLRRQFGDAAIDGLIEFANSNVKFTLEDIKNVIKIHKRVVF